MAEKENLEPMQIRITPAQRRALKIIAFKTRMKTSAIIRRALDQYFAQAQRLFNFNLDDDTIDFGER